jgi:phosphatidylserine synthase
VTSAARIGADLATLANGLLGVGAILYILAGNKLWAMLLIACGVGFDGLDGLLSRRAGGPPSVVGRVFDSVSDAVTFGLAPATLLAVHTEQVSLWASWYPYPLLVGALVGTLALARLTYFTWKSWQRPHFVGASTPQNALAVVVLLLFFDAPGFLGPNPAVVLLCAGLLALLMVLPVSYPKLRRGMPLRWAMIATAAALGISLLPLQFQPGVGTPLYLIGEAAATAAAVGLGVYYLVGPSTTRAFPGPANGGDLHG